MRFLIHTIGSAKKNGPIKHFINHILEVNRLNITSNHFATFQNISNLKQW